jgi:plasmid stabilization system protein ParE
MTEAALWYEDRVAGLGNRFLTEVEAALARIDEMPLLGPPWIHRGVPEGVRRMFVRSFPYTAIYVLEPRVVVVAIAHAHRRPGYWAPRLTGI